MTLIEILRAALYLSAGFDLGSTWKGMSIGQKEANPLLGQNRWVQAGIVVGSVVIVDLVGRWALSNGSTAGPVLLYTSVGVAHGVAFALNLRSFK